MRDQGPYKRTPERAQPPLTALVKRAPGGLSWWWCVVDAEGYLVSDLGWREFSPLEPDTSRVLRGVTLTRWGAHRRARRGAAKAWAWMNRPEDADDPERVVVTPNPGDPDEEF